MLGFMERSTIKLLKRRGNTNSEIARAVGRDRKTIVRALEEPADKKQKRPKRSSLVDPYQDKVFQWMQEGIPVTVMLERVLCFGYRVARSGKIHRTHMKAAIASSTNGYSGSARRRRWPSRMPFCALAIASQGMEI